MPLLGSLLLAGALYLLGVRRLQARGDAWPLGRTVVVRRLGLGTCAVATLSGLAAYDESLFAAHMVQHMLLSMVATVFLALGAPVTLALRTLPRGPRRLLLARAAQPARPRCSRFPLVGWVLFVASPFALYFSGWYEATLEHAGPARAAARALPAVGSLFFWPLLGIDPVPGRVSHPDADAARRLHPAVPRLPRRRRHERRARRARADRAATTTWRCTRWREAVHQQQVGGGLLWASGDLVGLLFTFTMLFQWMRASEREAAREDRRLDRLEARDARPAA